MLNYIKQAAAKRTV